jgi:hypothetical protein
MSDFNRWADLSGIPEDLVPKADAAADAWYLVQTGFVKHRFNEEKGVYEFALTEAGMDKFDPHRTKRNNDE